MYRLPSPRQRVLAASWVALGAALAGYRMFGGGLATSSREMSAKAPLRST
jgi:hypothetical protein